MTLAGLRMVVRDRPSSLFEIELSPLCERELTAALQGEQKYPEHVGKSLKAARQSRPAVGFISEAGDRAVRSTCRPLLRRACRTDAR
jgi:hypothetical protein